MAAIDISPVVRQVALRRAVAVALVVAAAIGGARVWLDRGALLDDAFITLRYADNLAAGRGPVFNPGEWVEGYSNPSWMALAAAVRLAGSDPLACWRWISLVSSLLALAVVARLAGPTGGAARDGSLAWHGGSVGGLAVALLLPAAAFSYYATTTMETALYVAVWLGLVWRGLVEAEGARRGGMALLALLLVVTRPEGPLLVGLAFAASLVLERTRTGHWQWSRLADLGPAAAGLAIHLLWRIRTYGELLPNTYDAKVTAGGEQLASGGLGLGQWALEHPLLALALPAAVVLAWRGGRRATVATAGVAPAESGWADSARTLYIAALALGAAAVAVAEGGDFMPYFRFFAPVTPLAAVLLARLAPRILAHCPRRCALVLPTLAVLVQAAVNLLSAEPARALVAQRTTAVGLRVGRELAAALPAGSWIAVNTAGAVPWASGLPAIDMLGLTDREIARTPVYVTSTGWAGHRRGCGGCVLARRPEVVLWYNSAGLAEPYYLGDHQLADHPYFRFFYELRRRVLPLAAGERDGRALAYLFGHPFGPIPHSDSSLGLRFQPDPTWWPRTAVLPAPVEVVVWGFRDELRPLWDVLFPTGGPPAMSLPPGAAEVDALLARASTFWRQSGATDRSGGESPRTRIEQECRLAAAEVARGELAAARQRLTTIAPMSWTARVGCVGQAIANLAYEDGDLPLALQGQLAALRAAPEDPIARHNLRHLLLVPSAELRRRQDPSRRTWEALPASVTRAHQKK